MSDKQVNIDDYIKGRMDVPTAAAFESQMASDPALANEVQDQAQVMNALEEAGSQELQSQIAAVSQQAQNKPKPKAEDTPPTPKNNDKSSRKANPKSGSAAVIKAIFRADGKEAEVIRLSYSFRQNVDNIGQPSAEVKGGIIGVELGSLGDPSRFAWAVNPDMKKSGEIEFIDANGKTLKTLIFEDAYCVAYTE